MADSLYKGKAGHLAVMSELCFRGYNVAMPEIDKGDDVFVVNDGSGAMWRIQVKTSSPKVQKKSRAFQFRVRETAITVPQTPELHFVFVMRDGTRWRFAVMDRPVLHNYVRAQNMGTAAGDYRQINMTLFDTGELKGSKISLTHHLEDWATWPEI